MKSKNSRVEWLDIMKGILIILMVVGHATGKFNGFIYQFHMAAFFLLSGYTTKLKKRTFIETLLYKFCTLFIPVLTAFCIVGGITWLLNKSGKYEVIFDVTQLPYVGAKFAISAFVKNGSFYPWWLGASWFIITLFNVDIILRLLFSICNHKVNVQMLSFSFGLFLFGYMLNSEGKSLPWYWTLALIAQFYTIIGILLSEVQYEEKKDMRVTLNRVVGVLITSVVSYAFYRTTHVTMDFASGKFNSPILDIFIVLNDTLLIFFMAKIIEKIGVLCKILSFMGSNTLGIVFFHFMYFKVIIGILYLLGVVDKSYLICYLPPEGTNAYVLILIIFGSIILSILSWKILSLIFKGIATGGASTEYNKAIEKCMNINWIGKANEFFK